MILKTRISFIRTVIVNFLLISILLLYSACSERNGNSNTQYELNSKKVLEAIRDSSTKSNVYFAKGFDIYNFENITVIIVHNPFISDSLTEVYLVSKEVNSVQNNSFNHFVSPVDSIAVFSATQLSALEKLGSLNAVVGVSEANYIKNPYVVQRINNGDILELAASGSFFVEKTLQVNPQIIFYSPYKAGEMHPLASTRIPMISFLDFLENDPLGRAEWIKFSAVFVGKEQLADSIFDQIVLEYDSLKLLAATVEEKPSVFSDKFFNSQWFVPGGASYISRMFADAGAEYIWKNDLQTGSFPLDYEVVYDKAKNADFWRIIGSYNEKPGYDALAAENELYTHFKAFSDHHIIYCDAEKSAYFEKSPLEPQVVLADLINAFHPGLLSGWEPVYYKVLP